MRTGPDKSTVAAVLERAGYRCEACGKLVGDERGVDYSIQHRKCRGMGGTKWFGINLPSNLLVLCGSGTTGCHGYVEEHPTEAMALGYAVSRYKDPFTVPVEIEGRLVWLTNSATYMEVANA